MESLRFFSAFPNLEELTLIHLTAPSLKGLVTAASNHLRTLRLSECSISEQVPQEQTGGCEESEDGCYLTPLHACQQLRTLEVRGRFYNEGGPVEQEDGTLNIFTEEERIETQFGNSEKKRAFAVSASSEAAERGVTAGAEGQRLK